MTIRESMKAELEANGLFPDQAESVMKSAEESELLESMAGRWSDSTTDYPQALLITTFLAVKRVASKWIEANLPDAWFRPMFE